MAKEVTDMVSRLSEMKGLDVFTEDGMHIGTCDDVAINPETGKVLGVTLTKIDGKFAKKIGLGSVGKGIVVPYMAVKSVGDVILVKNIVYAQKHE